MLARTLSATPWGIEALAVDVEIDVQHGLPQTQIVGLPDTAVRESRERVRAAIKNCGFALPPRSVTINLAPADLRKEGNHLDLAIAAALLVAHGHLPQASLDGRMFCGELGLDGQVRSIRGALSIADLATRVEIPELFVPAPNAAEAAALAGAPVIAVASLEQLVNHLTGVERLPIAHPLARPEAGRSLRHCLDWSEIRGQAIAKRALEVAAAGQHNALLIGPPGSGKTMLAQRLPGLLPELDPQEALEVTKVRSALGEERLEGLIRERPFRSPHPTISVAGLVGGGPMARPGEVSLAHTGVLFLDELPEFRRDVLESLRQPLEDGKVSVARARGRWLYPARFVLVAAMNPCPCGHLGDPRHACRCPGPLIERYRSRVSGPLLDRIDLHIEVPALRLSELKSAETESTALVASRVAAARRRQLTRRGVPNASLGNSELARDAALDAEGQRLMDAAFQRLGLSARALHRVLKVARTIADLGDSERVRPQHVAEAIQYRAFDRRATIEQVSRERSTGSGNAVPA
jgi:magnesium chelatase family protein